MVDGTFLKGTYARTLFVACTKYGNNKIFPLAFGTGDLENNDSWECFFWRFKEAHGEREDLCIASDRHNNIERAVNLVYNNPLTHGICVCHFQKNLKTTFKIASALKFYSSATNAYQIEDYDYYRKTLTELNPKIA